MSKIFQPLSFYAVSNGVAMVNLDEDRLKYELAMAMDLIADLECGLYNIEKWLKTRHGHFFDSTTFACVQDQSAKISDYYDDKGKFCVADRIKYDMIKNMPIDAYAEDAMNGG